MHFTLIKKTFPCQWLYQR